MHQLLPHRRPRPLLHTQVLPTSLPTSPPSSEPTTLIDLATRLRREQRLIDQTVYECSSCQERFLGERRCDGCNLWCRKLGLGGRCSGCDDVLTLSELLGFDLNSKEVTLT